MFVVTVYAKRGMAEQVRVGLDELSRASNRIGEVQWSDIYTAGVSIQMQILEEAMPVVEKIRSIDGVRSATIQLAAS